MSHRHKRKQSSEVNLGFQIAPMIDVVFVIMLYFMVMAGAVQVENSHNTKLPGDGDANPDSIPPDEIAIRVEDDGQVYLNDDPLDSPDPQDKALKELTSNLVQLQENSKSGGTEVLVTIYANEFAKYERVIDVMGALGQAKITNVTFQAGSPE
ncbi:MAG: biopolymer transporter ExbD [Akkermansiaceae bacterium]|nr:biopolymer transporter ExbD [Akkermansiaceae bacterium]